MPAAGQQQADAGGMHRVVDDIAEAAAVVFGENFSNADDQIASVGRFYLSIVRGDLGVSHKIILELVF